MTANGSNVTHMALDGGFGALRQEIETQAQAIRTAHPEEQSFSVDDEYALSRVAANGVLHILADQGDARASALAGNLAMTADKDPLTDLFSVAANYERIMQRTGDSTGAAEMAQLAEVVGGTAQAAVATVLGRRAALSSLRQARLAVADYDKLSGSIAGDTLHVLLDEAEKIPLDRQEPLAA